MTTWTCKTVMAVTACIALTACDTLPTLPVLDGLSATPKDDTTVALSQSQMANGAFTLMPSKGFCIDKSSLQQRFALLARCDTLGAGPDTGGAPAGVITVSVTPVGLQDTLPTPQETADALKLARVSDAKSAEKTVTFLAEGPPPNAELGAVHWRGTARIGNQIVGVALYGRKGGRAASAEGRGIVDDLINRSRKASEAGT